MKEKPVLQVTNLTKQYGNRVAVRNLDFIIQKGEIFGFLGSNGAGKSTTMKLITGLADPTSGAVYIDGVRLSSHFESCIKKVGAMIETPNFYPYLSGYQNLKYFASNYPNVTRRKIMETAMLVGLTSRIHDKVKTYSLGMKQRLGIAQALMHDPKLLILDEPTNGLDANGIREIKKFLYKIAKEKNVAIMISSHILSIMESLCDTICVIDKGKIIQTKTIDEIKKSCTKYGSHYIKTSKPNYAGFLVQEHFKTKVRVANNKILFNIEPEKLAEIIVHLTAHKVPIYAAGEIDYSLEDAYVDIIGDENKI